MLYFFLVSVACFSITRLLNYGYLSISKVVIQADIEGPPPPNCYCGMCGTRYMAAIKGCEYRHGHNTASRLFFRIRRLMVAIKGCGYRYGHNTAGFMVPDTFSYLLLFLIIFIITKGLWPREDPDLNPEKNVRIRRP